MTYKHNLLPRQLPFLTLTFASLTPALADRDVTEERCLWVEAGTEDSARLVGFFKGIELTVAFRLGVMEYLPFRVLTEEGMDVLNM